MKYIVIQVPKLKYLLSLCSRVVVVEAKSSAEAKRIALANPGWNIADGFKSPSVEEFTVGKMYLI